MMEEGKLTVNSRGESKTRKEKGGLKKSRPKSETLDKPEGEFGRCARKEVGQSGI